jgi:hypothetical protein
MPFTLADVVPWGRSYEEYCAMFDLGAADLARRIVGCADGPASFNAGATRRGGRVVSCDPLYAFDRAAIARRIDETFEEVMAEARRNAAEFAWRHVATPEALGTLRRVAMDAFLADYEGGRRAGRYVAAALPALPWSGDAFDLALCSHYLFLYSEHVDLAAHVAAIREMCRVAREARVFPLLALGSRPSPHVEPVRAALADAGLVATIERVPYEFQRGGDRMLRVRRAP